MVGSVLRTAKTLLFVPANRPDLFKKAEVGNADIIVLDLEDAVSESDKVVARENAAHHQIKEKPVVVRINAGATLHFEKDVAGLKQADIAGIMVPKAEETDKFSAIGHPLIALTETAKGIDNCRKIAQHEAVERLAFGSIDYAVDIGSSEERDALLHARHAIVFASRLGELNGPIDGVTANFSDSNALKSDVAYARSLGFRGKLLIHPKQVDPTQDGFRPSEEDVTWATNILDEFERSGKEGVASFAGEMIDRPVLLRAQDILASQ